MPRFQFRLQKVLEYRGTMEDRAKDAYLEARVSRLACEQEIEVVRDRRRRYLQEPVHDLDEYRVLEILLSKLDDDERHLLTILDVLRHDEEVRRQAWLAAKRDLEVLEKLREKALEDWTLTETRREQAELDEWSSLRRAA